MTWSRETYGSNAFPGDRQEFYYEFTYPLTLKDALEMCVDMWDYLGATGARHKPATNLRSDCALCEYCNVGQDLPLDCSKCPVQWDDEHPLPNKMYACLGHGSLYELWKDCPADQRAEIAMAIADRAQIVLQRME